MKKLLEKLLVVVLVGAMVLPLIGCGARTRISSEKLEYESDIMIDYEHIPAEYEHQAMTDFAVRLFQNTIDAEKNILISPLSVMVALSMTANGAKNNTLEQMEEVLGLRSNELDVYLYNYKKKLPQGDKYKLQLANSIWFTDDERFTVREDFLSVNKAYYQSDIYRTAFDDTTLKDINLWVEQKTDGMIKNVLNEIPKDALMYLINALTFDAKWQKTYEKGEVRDATFTTEDGKEQKIELMYSDESAYLEDEQATGFIKYYADRKYAFVALLPKEGVSVADYVKEMSGDKLRALIANPQSIHVDAAIPVFETEYNVLMNDVLIQMGMTDAFNGGMADFSELGTSTHGNIFIGRVIHKTYITVGPQGTRAGAATVVEMKDESAPFFEETKTVHLDRPFVYMLIDCENNQPFFMGTLMSVDN